MRPSFDLTDLTSFTPARRTASRMRLLPVLLALLPAFASAAFAKPLVTGTAVIEATRRADVAVVVYREVLGEIGDADRGPTLTVYGDGRMVAHYPRYMKRAGDYEHRLTTAEVDALLQSLASKGVLDFDGPATRTAARSSLAAERQRARAANVPIQLFEAVDASTTVIEVAVDRYVAAAPGARAAQNVVARAVWTGLRTDAEQRHDVPALRDLAAAEQELRALRERPGFTRVR